MAVLTHDETNLLCIYAENTRENTIKGIRKMMKYLEADEKELMAMSRSLLDKLGNMSDEEFDQLEKYPDFDR